MQQQVEAAKAGKKGKKLDVPMSENFHKITDTWTADRCIEELRRVAKLDEDKVVTFDYIQVCDHAVAGGKWYYPEERDPFLKSVTVH
ncbi:hypothetical protein PQQ87_08785 [Paraburkholderia nemoris]|uniref:hypothetical protein n=1 Tax=Paraburkholderia nemoris TaxID=2793076 RepID=UPI0038B85AD2